MTRLLSEIKRQWNSLLDTLHASSHCCIFTKLHRLSDTKNTKCGAHCVVPNEPCFSRVPRYLTVMLHSHEEEQLRCSNLPRLPQLARGCHILRFRTGSGNRRVITLFVSNSTSLMDLLKAPWVESVSLNGIL